VPRTCRVSGLVERREREPVDVAGAQRAEVAPVECGELRFGESLGDREDGGTDSQAMQLHPQGVHVCAVTPAADESLMTLRKAAMELLQLNRAASHPCSHEDLHALLDEVTALMHEQERPAEATAPEA